MWKQTLVTAAKKLLQNIAVEVAEQMLAYASGKHRRNSARSRFIWSMESAEDTIDKALLRFESGDESLDFLLSACKEAANDLNDLADDCRDKWRNMPDQLQYCGTGSLLADRADSCEAIAREIESAIETISKMKKHSKKKVVEIIRSIRWYYD